jgi:UDP-N-acetylmuramoylalanine--D-glutamate ligase
MTKMLESFGHRIGVYGLGVSGKAGVTYLSRHGIKPVIIDDAPLEKLQPSLDEFSGMYSEVFCGIENRDWGMLFDNLDTIIISPGIKLALEIDQLAIEKSVKIISEIEFAFQLCNGRIICVSGSNGKSTTVTMIHRMLESAGFHSHLVGNIGIAFISAIDDIHEGDWVVLEVSSYQLERIEKFKPYIAVLTNITEDHLARHGDMDGYIAAKGRMFLNQDYNDHAILNHEDMNTWRAFGGAQSSMHVFTLEDFDELPSRELINGQDIMHYAAMMGDLLAIREDEEFHTILAKQELIVPGRHNIQNALCASLAAYLAGVPKKMIASALREFRGIEHRIEFLGEFKGVRFYNDSKATNVDSTITALKTFEEGFLHLILGGSEKGSDFTPLWEFLRERDDPFKLYLSGPSGSRMAEDLKDEKWNFDYKLCENFKTCTEAAFKEARENQIVLLSPACASFDEFRNFEERGLRFRQLLSDYMGAKSAE